MTYKQAKEIVLKAYPNSMLAALRTVSKRVQTWNDREGYRKLETKSVTHDYYILVPNSGRDLCNGSRSRTKAPAWIAAGMAIRGY